jgi:hypothetical protein
MEVGAMVRNHKFVMLGGGVLAGAAALALAAEALLWRSVHAPASPDAYTLPASLVIRGGGDAAVFRAGVLEGLDAAGRRDRGPPGNDPRAGRTGR